MESGLKSDFLKPSIWKDLKIDPRGRPTLLLVWVKGGVGKWHLTLYRSPYEKKIEIFAVAALLNSFPHFEYAPAMMGSALEYLKMSGLVQVNSPEPRVGADAGRVGRWVGVCRRGGQDQSVALSGTASRCERDVRWQTYKQRLAALSAYPGRDKMLARNMTLRCPLRLPSYIVTASQPASHRRLA